MRRGGGKAKGSAFERRVAKALSLWLTGKKDGRQLIRSVMSGGWQKGKTTEKDWRQVGDLAPNGPVGERFRKRYAVECKHTKDIDIHHLWTKGSGGLTAWWHKLLEDCDKHKLAPMLIFKPNCMPIMVGMRYDDIPLRIREFARFEWQGDLVLFPFEELLSRYDGCEFLSLWL